MNTAPDAGDGATFSPQQAAALLDETTWQARRKFQPSPPWLLATRAVLVLAALGSIWLSVRGQHPYKGPTAADIPILVGFIIVNFAVTVGVRRRATAGVAGASRFRPVEIMVLVLAVAAVPVFMWTLAAAGVSFAWYPTTVMILPGLAWAVLSAIRANWVDCGTGLGCLAVGAVGAFAGPAGSWAVAGVGLCAVLLARAAAGAWQQHG